MNPYFSDAGISLYVGDCLDVLPGLPAESVDAIVTDPPYHLTEPRSGGNGKGKAWAKRSEEAKAARRGGFMGKAWDGGDIAFRPEVWAEIMRVAKPGAHLLAFGGTRTHHRLVCAIEDAGWEIRDTIMWVYGSGFPKSLDVSKAIDKEANAEREILGRSSRHGGGNSVTIPDYNRYGVSGDHVTAPATEAAKQWDGWGTALKPAVEPIVLARKPLVGTVAQNVQRYGTGALNIDGCRIETTESTERTQNDGPTWSGKYEGGRRVNGGNSGRWPANLIHDGSPEVVECFPDEAGGGIVKPYKRKSHDYYSGSWPDSHGGGHDSGGSASRFFYCAKASKADRHSEAGNDHPTVKPLALIQYLVKLITPPGGLVLDPFMGSGTTAKAAHELGFRCIGIDLEERHCEIAAKRLTQTVLDFGGAA